jgi:phospholipid/cholesterol/gamma-HCH transport system permease protein
MRMPGAEIIDWLSPLGRSLRLIVGTFSWQSFKNLSWADIRYHCRWIGLESFYLVALSAVVVAIALLIQCVIELQKYRVHDLSGAIIAIGLLREIGPLTVGLAWAARVSARISEEALIAKDNNNEREFTQNFILPRYVAALLMATPLAAYGLIIGFITAALAAPLLSVSTTEAFLDSAQRAVENKDLIVYFLKVGIVLPFVSVFAGCNSGIVRGKSPGAISADAVTATFACSFMANLMVTILMYYR